ncbi:MAG TPA: glycosyltransferase family 4 protein [Micromonospora sp.]
MSEATEEWTGSLALVLGSSTGGVGRHVASLVRNLVPSGVTVTVCGPGATDEQFGFTAAGARFVPVEIPPNPRLTDLRAVAALRKVLAGRIDVVHAHGLRAGLVATLARPTQPLVVTQHNAILADGMRGRLSHLAERIVARGARVVLGASGDLVARARALGAVDARLVPVAAPPLPPPRRTPTAVRAELGVAPDQPLILSVGRLHPQKRYDVLIDAAAALRDLRPRPVVVIAGAGPMYTRLAGRISATRAPVLLVGHRTDVADLLAAADLAVVTSDWEARQLFAQEAMRAGVPLVTTAVGGLPELVGDAAVLVPPGDAVAVADALRGLLTDPERRAEYGRRGRAHAETWPTEADTVASVRAIYGELTGQARAARARAARSVTATGTPVRPVAGGDVAERG